MHPTIDEQLEGIARLIERTAERFPRDPSVDRLRTAAGTLRRIAGSWDAMGSFFAWDNDTMLALFTTLEAHLPNGAPTRARSLATAKIADATVRTAHDHNKALRELLVEVIQSLPANASAPRVKIAAHLRERIARDPSAGRARRS